MVMNVRQLHDQITILLRQHGLAEARREAGQLLTAIWQWSPADLYRRNSEEVSAQEVSKVMALAQKRAQRVPLAYLTGRTCFFDRNFAVYPGVLIPRSDSEVLVEAALDWLFKQPLFLPERSGRTVAILDLCAGTGCIGISIADQLRRSGIPVWLELTEIDPLACSCIEENLRVHGLTGCSRLSCTDLFPPPGRRYDLLVANPPYIPRDQINDLMPEVRLYEPHDALDGGPDGLAFYRQIIDKAPAFLQDPGALLLEHGYDQDESVHELLRQAGQYQLLPLRLDYGNRPRVSGAVIKNQA